MSDPIEEVLIIGGGPAGLSAASACKDFRPLLIEGGPGIDDRNQFDPLTNTEGIGGAGLYSDGKVSFRPSATQVWQLNEDLLHPAWLRVVELLEGTGVRVPSESGTPAAPAAKASYIDKRYLSAYATPYQRLQLIDRLVSEVPRAETKTRAVEIRAQEHGWDVLTSRGWISTRNLILATGRFGQNLLASTTHKIATRVLRLEVGVRLEQPRDLFFLGGHDQVDPKLIWIDEELATEWRTFCCCRDGLVASTRTQGMLTVSGRADCPPTGRSNIGFNVRITSPTAIEAAWPDLARTLRELPLPVAVSLDDFLSEPQSTPIGSILGSVVTARLAKGLARLLKDFSPEALAQATLIGPTVEGVGVYPVHDDTMKSGSENLWFAGDVVGTFRGLTAALVSGQVAGSACVKTVKGVVDAS